MWQAWRKHFKTFLVIIGIGGIDAKFTIHVDDPSLSFEGKINANLTTRANAAQIDIISVTENYLKNTMRKFIGGFCHLELASAVRNTTRTANTHTGETLN